MGGGAILANDYCLYLSSLLLLLFIKTLLFWMPFFLNNVLLVITCKWGASQYIFLSLLI